MIEVRSLVDGNYDDAVHVVEQCFPKESVNVLRLAMRNPLRQICEEVGDIAYENGRPVSFQAVYLRKVFLAGKEYVGHVSGLTSNVADSSFKAVMAIRKAAHYAQKKRGDAKIRFGNTHCESTEQLAKVLKRKLGPCTCERYLWAPIRPMQCLWYILKRKVLHWQVQYLEWGQTKGHEFQCNVGRVDIRRLPVIDGEFFDALNHSISTKCSGLVCSRSADDMAWMFGDRVKNGTCVLLGARVGGAPVGYVALTSSIQARRWMLMDWVAAGNDQLVLRALLVAARRYLHSCTPAIMLETIGFPEFIQPLLKRYLPYSRLTGNNFFSYNYPDVDFERICEPVLHGEQSWFFGPYDGDMCMG